MRAVSGPLALSKNTDGTTNSRMIQRSTLTLPYDTHCSTWACATGSSGMNFGPGKVRSM